MGGIYRHAWRGIQLAIRQWGGCGGDTQSEGFLCRLCLLGLCVLPPLQIASSVLNPKHNGPSGNVGRCTGAMTDISFIAFDEFLSQIIKPLKMITGIRNLSRFEPQPFHRLPDGSKVDFVFRLRVCIVVPEVTNPVVVASIAKAYGYGFRMSDVQEPVGFGGKSGDDFASRGFEVLGREARNELGISTGFVEVAEPAFGEHGGEDALCCISLRRFYFCLGCLGLGFVLQCHSKGLFNGIPFSRVGYLVHPLDQGVVQTSC